MKMMHVELMAAVIVASLSTVASGTTFWVNGSATSKVADGSPRRPFKKIGEALAIAQPGDTVAVCGGVYREKLRLPSGEPGKPITLRAANGNRVIVSGCARLGDWKPAGKGRWATMLDWEPKRLLIDARPQTIAREPNEGWWRSTGADGAKLIDPSNLKAFGGKPTGGDVRVWLQRGNAFGTFPIKHLDTQSGQITLDIGGKSSRLTPGDKYHLQNRTALIDLPGEWAVERQGEKFLITLMPRDEQQLLRVEAPYLDGPLIAMRDRSHLRIEGLEVTGSRRFGIEAHDSTDVVIRQCIVHHNAYTGISLRETTDCTAARNIVWQNEYGISVSYSSRVLVEENDVGHNGVDGILVTWKSDDIIVRRNYVHDHLLWGHPDNLQVYRGVTNARFQDNLLLAAGQSVMMEETSRGQFTGNMVVGCGAYMLIMGHGNAGDYLIQGNTLAMAGYGCLNLTGRDYEVRENVMMTGHAGPMFGLKGIAGYVGDHNLFWNSSRCEKPTILATDDGWLRDFDAVQYSTGQDEHSIYAEPRFRNAPIAFCVLDGKLLHECTRDTWHLRRAEGLFRAGDLIEVNCDGVRRRVTRVDGNTITTSPGLSEKPAKGWLVANWGDNEDFRLDLRLMEHSPGVTASPSGKPLGSKIDIQAYRRGDFDGDGQRDLPKLPDCLRIR